MLHALAHEGFRAAAAGLGFTGTRCNCRLWGRVQDVGLQLRVTDGLVQGFGTLGASVLRP